MRYDFVDLNLLEGCTCVLAPVVCPYPVDRAPLFNVAAKQGKCCRYVALTLDVVDPADLCKIVHEEHHILVAVLERRRQRTGDIRPHEVERRHTLLVSDARVWHIMLLAGCAGSAEALWQAVLVVGSNVAGHSS